MSLHLILGPMFSGKSTELLRLGRRHELAGRQVVYVCHALDAKRHPPGGRIHTHDGVGPMALMVTELRDLLPKLCASTVQVICIDEGQFFKDLHRVALTLCNRHSKRVIIAGLNATFRQELFPPIASVLPMAEHVSWLKAVCFHCGSDQAQFTHRLLGHAGINKVASPFPKLEHARFL